MKVLHILGCSTNYIIFIQENTIWGIQNRELVMRINSGICENILKALKKYIYLRYDFFRIVSYTTN